ncbi:MAG: Holliday junction branch migration protein RuvA [Bacilli bacterium]|nr:Holliday junction branch migration protein RuvA [Acholeplasmataceae bacterium]MDY2903125.1 Holliday junction branch migration protein RuvA [Bacilli bacterium]
MFDYIKGTITIVNSNYIVVENNNIGYIIHTASPFSFKENENLTIYIYTYIREDIFDLYGFKTIEERNLFIKLISVKGIGPKGALAILANGDLDGLKNAIETSDAKYLQKYPGIGPKASGQIILDLKGKLEIGHIVDPKVDSVKEALKSLGYSNMELKKIDKFLEENKDLSIEQLVKLSLKKLF